MLVPVLNAGLDPADELLEHPELVPVRRRVGQRSRRKEARKQLRLAFFCSDQLPRWVVESLLQLEVLPAEAI